MPTKTVIKAANMVARLWARKQLSATLLLRSLAPPTDQTASRPPLLEPLLLSTRSRFVLRFISQTMLLFGVSKHTYHLPHDKKIVDDG